MAPAAILRLLLRLAGKRGGKVIAVFGSDPADCHRAVEHLSGEGLPLRLFTAAPPWPQTAALCESVTVRRNSVALLLAAQRQLWRHWVALGVTAWTGRQRAGLLKLAPFLTPPFRVLLLNEHGDFFAGTPRGVLGHAAHRMRDRAHSTWYWGGDHARGYWELVSYHVWRSGPVRRVKDQALGLLLLAAVGILRLTGNPHRWIFRHLTGGLSLDCDPQPVSSRSAGVAHFRQQGTAWDGAAFENFARSTDARWILWLGLANARVEIEELLPLLQEPGAFAASLQTHLRAWKPSLLPTAPFRALQRGEATAVLAPLAPAILVDRAKLLALGVPHCGLPAAAWMLLFWKAAAAGWRSYSAGQKQAAAEQPDLPVQEASVFLRVACDPGLRRLAPRQPDLLRGNIAAFPALQSHYRSGERPKVLVVSPFLPYPLSHGGAVRIYNLCRALSGRVDFLLTAMRESQETVDYPRLHEVFRQVCVVDRDEIPSPDRALPGQVRQYQSRSLRALIAEMSRRWKPDILQIEFTHMAGFRDAAPEIPALLVEHDLTYSLYGQLAGQLSGGFHERRAAQAEYQRWLAFERRWLARYDAVWTVSEKDRQAAIEAGGRDPGFTCTVPNGVDLDRFQPCPETAGAPLEILYVGSFRHLPNFLGFEKLRTEIMPRLWSRHPSARLRVVAGPLHERFWRQFAMGGAASKPGDSLDPRIEIHGFVEDLRPLYARAAVAAVPLDVSAGTNIKVTEAMACGRAVVTTPVGCAGLDLEDGGDALIRPDAASFADALADLLADAPRRRALARRGRLTVEQRFGWQAIGEIACQSYEALARRLMGTAR